MKIVKIAIRNFLGISDFEAALSPGVNVVRGANGTGKSSFLKAFWKAIRGGKGDAPWVIHRLHNGEAVDASNGAPDIQADERIDSRVAEILVELDGSYKVRRRIAEAGSTLQVTKKEGPIDVEIRSPQAWLDSLVGPVFQAVEFFKASPAERRKVLLSVVPAMLTFDDLAAIINSHGCHWTFFAESAPGNVTPIDGMKKKIGLAELAEIEQSLMDRRKAAHSEKEHHEEAAKAEANKYPAEYKPVDLPDFQAIMRRYDAAQATVKRVEALHFASSTADQAVKNTDDMVEELERRLKNAMESAAEAKAIAEQIAGERMVARNAIVDPAPIKLELADYERNKAWRMAWDAAKDHADERDRRAAEVRAFDGAIQQGIRVEAPRLLWSRLAETPLGGLEIGMMEDRITVKGVDVDNLSQSEQAKLAMRIAEVSAGELKVIGMDQFESLDAESRASFREHASPEFQYIVCQVDDGPLRVES